MVVADMVEPPIKDMQNGQDLCQPQPEELIFISVARIQTNTCLVLGPIQVYVAETVRARLPGCPAHFAFYHFMIVKYFFSKLNMI